MAKGRQTVSLRIDTQLESELAFIKLKLNLDSSKAIKEAIHSKYLQILEKMPKKNSYETLKNSGFVGSFDGPPELSSNYKVNTLNYLKGKSGKR